MPQRGAVKSPLTCALGAGAAHVATPSGVSVVSPAERAMATQAASEQTSDVSGFRRNMRSPIYFDSVFHKNVYSSATILAFCS